MNSKFPHPEISYFGDTIPGRRENNQDNFISRQLNAHTFCFAVADGMGGSNNGEIASRIVIQDIELFLSNKFRNEADVLDLKTILHDCFIYVQDRFVEYTSANPEHAGMGTTLVLLLISGNRCAWGNIGDSRLYGIINGNIKQLTVDHTLIQQMKNEGTPVDSEMTARYSHLLTKCINGGVQIPDIFPAETDALILDKPAGFILCSDGLILNKSENDEKEKFGEIFTQGKSLADISRKLIHYAYTNGSSDNITALLVQVGLWKRLASKRKVFSKLTLLTFLSVFALLAVFLLFSPAKFLSIQNNPLHISIFGKNTSTSNKNSLHWKPLDSNDQIVKTSSSHIVWAPFPKQEEVKYYLLNVYNTKSTKSDIVRIRPKFQYYKLKSLKTIIYPGRYFIRIDAILMNDSLVQGNTVRLMTKEE